jgi:hypothetical protein
MAKLQLSVVSDPASKDQIQGRSNKKLKHMAGLQLSVVSDFASGMVQSRQSEAEAHV